MGAKRTVKVAIVGSGLAGLTAAHLLMSANDTTNAAQFEVHIFEKVLSSTSCARIQIMNLSVFRRRLLGWTRIRLMWRQRTKLFELMFL